MRTNMTIYEGAFRNIETNLENENIQQTIAVRIYDTETQYDFLNNPHEISFAVSSNGNGTQTVFITLGNVDAFTVSIAFGYFDGTDWHFTDIDPSLSQATITIPEGDWDYHYIANETEYDLTASTGGVYDLEMAEPPVKISIVDNDEDKFTPIRSKEAEIQIFSSNDIDISTFAEGGDNRYYVEIETFAEGIIFKGWLSINDLSQEFQPDPDIIVLVASDGLGFLKDEPLKNFENEFPLDKYPIINFISWALFKTGLALDIKVCMNIRETTSVPLVSDDSGAGHMYSQIYLDAKTFESEIGECEDCYAVLSKILGENSFLTQYKGDWVIVRIDEMETGHEYFFSKYNYLGEWIENTEETFIKNIGALYPLSFMNDDAVVTLERPYKQIIERFNHNYPKEIICNIDFNRGDFIADLPDETNEDGVTRTVKKYSLDCWDRLSHQGGSNTFDDWENPLPGDADLFIKKFYENDTEVSREAVIINGSGSGDSYFKSQAIPVTIKDKIELSVDLHYENVSGSGFTNSPVEVALFADSGNIYWWKAYDVGDPTLKQQWLLTPSNIGLPHWYEGADVDGPPLSMNFTSPPLPESGTLVIFLISWYGDGIEAHYGAVRLQIYPLINGSYRRYIAQTHDVLEDNPKIKAIRETEVFISDAPRIAMKGALLKPGTLPNTYQLANEFYNAAKNTAGPASADDVMRFGRIQAFDVWNQYNRVMRKFEGTVDRTDSTSQIPDILHKYILQDVNENTTDTVNYRMFQLLHFEMDLHMCEWDCFLHECLNTGVPKVYENETFKYITE